MATVRPPHLAPLPPPPAPPAPPPPSLPRSPRTRSRRAGDHGRKESVAESCCPAEAVNVVIDVDSGSDDDGCGSGSCVGGSEGGRGQDEKGNDVFRWSRERGSCFLWPPRASRAATNGHAGDDRGDDDPKAAAARRQEEDRKFWEACLASGYP